MSPPPRIAITGVVRTYDGADRTGVNAAYTRAVQAAGGLPLILPSILAPETADQALAAIDGLLLTGGEDLDPARYGAERSPRTEPPDPQRDGFELALFGAARRRGIPILGICRGLQLINVALGGTLWQDLPTERPGPVDHNPSRPRNTRTHRVRLEQATRTATAAGRADFIANSFHHQAVQQLAPDLRATGWTDDDLIEAAECRNGGPWLVAVQWHPEEMYAEPDSPDQGLFRALVREAAAFAAARSQDQTIP